MVLRERSPSNQGNLSGYLVLKSIRSLPKASRVVSLLIASGGIVFCTARAQISLMLTSVNSVSGGKKDLSIPSSTSMYLFNSDADDAFWLSTGRTIKENCLPVACISSLLTISRRAGAKSMRESRLTFSVCLALRELPRLMNKASNRVHCAPKDHVGLADCFLGWFPKNFMLPAYHRLFARLSAFRKI